MTPLMSRGGREMTPLRVIFKGMLKTVPSNNPLSALDSQLAVGTSKETHVCMSASTLRKSRGSWGNRGS